MPPSLSTIERGNPPPRRKSCAACIKAKRRCDLRQPSCSRCTQRKIECSYPARVETIGKRHYSTVSSQAGISPNAQLQELVQDAVPELDSWETTFDFNMDLGQSHNSSCPSFPTLSFEEPSFQGLDFIEEVVNTDGVLNQISPTPGPVLGLEDPMSVATRSTKSSIATSQRAQLLSLISEVVERRLSYTIDLLKRAPEMMVLSSGTPWSHPALYRDSMPTFLEDAVAACALHRAKNNANTVMIQRVIEQRYQKLLDAPVPTTNAPELMARTHALLLYQLMLFFDDSWVARTLASDTISELSDTATALMDFVHQLSEDEGEDNESSPSRDIPLYPPSTARAIYHDWTFQESVRRTVLVSFLFIQLHCILRPELPGPIRQMLHHSACGALSHLPPSDAMAVVRKTLQESSCHENEGGCDARLLFCRSITLSSYLWRARDPIEFAVAWREKKHLVARPWDIWSVMDRAEPDDIDQFGRMLMSAGMEVETARAWFVSKGSTL
ncbi:hypothetical protein F4861DRAFT_40553 [Xylaria intraflava]|nr:hypothetical protein F4861DRAFT_40553 [Xylaria intraflava]